MQYDEGNTHPVPCQMFLLQQVQEQSEVCDVTVKLGHWEKRFHRCVLISSPFFDKALNSNFFLEHQTGKIEIAIGTPITLQMAIRFLYGETPKLSEDNIEQMLHLAEFLLIPNLKSSCISWLKTVGISEKNCMSYIQLSGVFYFDIPKCSEFMESHLTEMLENPETVNLTKDSIFSLFSDKRLSYVTVDDRLKFLIRWRDDRPEKRNKCFKELLTTIDFHDVTPSLLEELQGVPGLNEFIDFEKALEDLANESDQHRVLFIRNESDDGSFVCLDFQREQWFKHYSRAVGCFDQLEKITGSSSGPHTFFSRRYSSSILQVNLETDECRTLLMVETESGNVFQRFDEIAVHGETCIVSVNAVSLPNVPRSIKQQMLAHYCHTSSCLYTHTSLLYIGNLCDENILKMSPLLILKEDFVSRICIHNTGTSIAMLFATNRFVSVFDLTDHTLERIHVKTQNDDVLVQSEDGFVIYNNSRCFCLQRLRGPSLLTKFHIQEIFFCNTFCRQENFFLCGNTWYRYIIGLRDYQVNFESLPHTCAMSNGLIENAAWKQLPLPGQISKYMYLKQPKNHCFFESVISKRKLRCDIECPHCKVNGATQGLESWYDSDDMRAEYEHDLFGDYPSDSDDYGLYPYDGW